MSHDEILTIRDAWTHWQTRYQCATQTGYHHHPRTKILRTPVDIGIFNIYCNFKLQFRAK